MNSDDSLVIIDQWFKSHCNGLWEHKYGVELTTTDNPGWMAVIDDQLSNNCFNKIKEDIILWESECMQNENSIRVYSKTLLGCITSVAHILKTKAIIK
jgi:hypothetical protein